MHDHLGHLNLVANKAIFADSWNEGCQKPSKKNKQYSQALEGGPRPRLSEYCFFFVFVHRVQNFPQSALLVVQRQMLSRFLANVCSFESTYVKKTALPGGHPVKICQNNYTARRALCYITFVIKKTTLPGVRSAEDSALCEHFLKKTR